MSPAMPAALDVLRDVFGHDSFRPGQGEVIEAVLAGRDCLAVMPTGAGKSVTFQLPARVLGGMVLVVSPLISLMKDQVDQATARGLRATLVNSTLDDAERASRIAGVAAGEYELLYVAPEGLQRLLSAASIRDRVSMVAIDEAHCISAWGHDFRPAYRQLSGLKQRLGGVPVMAVTATATTRVSEDIVRQLGMSDPFSYRGSFYRPNLRIAARKKDGIGDTRGEILAVVRAHEGECGVVYCLTRRSSGSLATWLQRQGVAARAYHAGMEDTERIEVQEAFVRGEARVIVATVAFGMGIDKADVRFVIHQDLPGSVEAYAQEIGRAGRDGEPSDCVLFYSWADVKRRDAMIEAIEDPAYRREVAQRTRAMYRLADGDDCRHRSLAAWFDETIGDCGGPCDVCGDVSAPRLIREGTAKERQGRVFGSGIAPGASSARDRAAAPGSMRHATREALEPDDAALFDRLREVRLELAKELGVPAYVVFPDSTLAAMAAARPADEAAMLALSGVGEVKLARFGGTFLRAVAGDGGPDPDGEADAPGC
jgi:ATP-dependent DNA helicase RecQ